MNTIFVSVWIAVSGASNQSMQTYSPPVKTEAQCRALVSAASYLKSATCVPVEIPVTYIIEGKSK